MIKIIRNDERYNFQGDWLNTFWHFSFDHYFDPENVSFGYLRVFNDDVVNAKSGFPYHDHANMEIVTYVLEGQLSHKDSLGNLGTINAGEVQRMSAGKGIMHSEFNDSKEKVHLLQIWLQPNQFDLQPSWEQKQFTKQQRTNNLLQIVSPKKENNALFINQNAQFFVSFLEKGKSLSQKAKDSDYLFVISGEIELNGNALVSGDQARMENEKQINISALKDSELILIQME
ncbi:MAG: pirin family protein [archaeon]|nr:pirin family protein [archaeon]